MAFVQRDTQVVLLGRHQQLNHEELHDKGKADQHNLFLVFGVQGPVSVNLKTVELELEKFIFVWRDQKLVFQVVD